MNKDKILTALAGGCFALFAFCLMQIYLMNAELARLSERIEGLKELIRNLSAAGGVG